MPHFALSRHAIVHRRFEPPLVLNSARDMPPTYCSPYAFPSAAGAAGVERLRAPPLLLQPILRIERL